MKKVFKYPLDTNSAMTSLILPSFSKPLMVQFQNYNLQIWIEHSDEFFDETTSIEVVIFPTGADIPDNFQHLNSFQHGTYVWHCYYRIL